ncbi:DUF4097 family beta strand repeat-containing protein [uncultured Shewanella sp.]|uniref:DUF4097 family beta strand repeat-containing protein n=1 Tax=uncultured Shewanella sp. TaxID=173975 RepID=UPI002623AC2E|nr:DUF4097 family beta strand repeat-containing protein [uncultured Shewanella sp.]
MFRSLIVMSILLLSLSGCIIYVEGANHSSLKHKQETKIINTEDLNSLVANVGAGQLTIKGVKGQKDIMVTANIYYHENTPYILTLKKHGHVAKLNAKFEQHKSLHPSPYIDLMISIPEHLTLDVNDGSGAIKITNMKANIQLNDGSGNIQIVGGHQLNIEDGSGSITIKNNSANIAITDGSGAVNIRNSSGDVTIDDGSGDITLQHIAGNISIDDGSGDINVNTSQGKVTLDDGSGDINVYNTKGLTILTSGSGEVNFDDIQGPIKL